MLLPSGRWKGHRVNLLQFEFWGVNQNLIPNMWQMVFAHISVEGWIIDPYVQSLFYCSYLVQVLPPNNFEIVDGNTVTTDVIVVIYGRGGFQMFLETFLPWAKLCHSTEKSLNHTVCGSYRTCMYQVRRRQGRRVQGSSEGSHPKDPKTKTKPNQRWKEGHRWAEERPVQDDPDCR